MSEVISESDFLYRRFFRNQYVQGIDGMRVSSQAYFQRKADIGLSVNLARMSTPEDTLKGGTPEMGVGELSASVPLNNEITLEHAPETLNQAHVLMFGDFSSKSRRKLLAAATKVVLPPSNKS